MDNTTPFWQEVRRSLMVRGDGWKPVIEDLPNHINSAEARELIQPAEQLSLLNGMGFIAGGKIETQLDASIVLPYLNDKTLNLENVTLQWLYRFIIVEGLVEHNRTNNMTTWAPMFLHMVDQGLNFMVYMSALLVLYEEKKIDAVFADATLHESL